MELLEGIKQNYSVFSKENGSTNWEFDFGSIGALSFLPIIDIHIDILYVFVKIDRNEGQIIGIDVNSGELVFQSSNKLEGDNVSIEKLPIVHNFSLDSYGKLIGIYGYWIYSVDIKTGIVSVKDLQEHLSNHDIRELNANGGLSEIGENYLLTGSQKMKHEIEGFIPTTFIVALNYESFEVDWKYPIDNIAETPSQTEKQILLRTHNKKLITFEKMSQ